VSVASSAGSPAEPAGERDGTVRAPHLRAPRAAVPLPPAFPDGRGHVPAPLGVHATVAALQDAGSGAHGWRNDAMHDGPAFRFTQPRGVALVSVRPVTLPPNLPVDRVWEQVRQLGDLSVDVLLAALAQWYAGHDVDGWAIITASAILDYRGIRPKTKCEGVTHYRAGHRVEDQAAIAERFIGLADVWVAIDEQIIGDDGMAPTHRHRGRRRYLRYVKEGRLLHIDTQERVVQGTLDGSPPATLAFRWRFRIGEWLRPFLTAPNLQVAPLLRRALEYDPLQERWEKRLAVYFALHLTRGAAQGTPLTRGIGLMLDRAALRLDPAHPGASVARFETALKRLVADCVIARWQPSYDLRALSPRGWVPAWRTSTITVWPSPGPTLAAGDAPSRASGRARPRRSERRTPTLRAQNPDAPSALREIGEGPSRPQVLTRHGDPRRVACRRG